MRRAQLIRVLPVIGLGLLAVAPVALTVRYVPIRNRMVFGDRHARALSHAGGTAPRRSLLSLAMLG